MPSQSLHTLLSEENLEWLKINLSPSSEKKKEKRHMLQKHIGLMKEAASADKVVSDDDSVKFNWPNCEANPEIYNWIFLILCTN